ncbi:uncharacterized protein N0V89_003955 [Didymosphaeria variabile]|uniref:Ribosomal protein/NADH dehydrogenase domain-containing protein n=1 Tax=Didymosphaeria variabile TaxID=1932322 RepID=A0A9W9CCQ5_9PLEO|nr:uncharacterized protein N0V89_003955 [Didymosphaeria variabile]KAJ4355930.1 hypothetical protein N0V89_003955 [Didymosphaeria variabile]
MVNIIKRMRKLREKVKNTRNSFPRLQDTRQALLWIRNGPGAIQLPKEVTKISMEFHKKLIGSHHRGARHFWHEMLPRIKYRNPALPISITRHDDPAGPAYLHIYTSPKSSASQTMNTPGTGNATPEPNNILTPDTSTPTHTVDIKALHESEILEALVEKTGAVVLQTPPEEAQEMAEIEEFKERSDIDRVEVREKLMKVRREEELLRLARGEVPNAA